MRPQRHIPRLCHKTALVAVLLIWSSTFGVASPSPQPLSPQAPVDKPVSIGNAEQTRKFEAAIAPYVKQAKATLPQAKTRFLAGLPKGDHFLVTIRMYDAGGQFEQVFVGVTSWEGQTIHGILASDTPIIHRRPSEVVTCKEQDVLDWTISQADGTEEGNFVGKFLDTYKP